MSKVTAIKRRQQINKKSSAHDKIKDIVIQALGQFFEQSGVNELLLTLYENSKGGTARTSQQQRKVQNILESNPDRQSLSKNWVQQSGMFDGGKQIPQSQVGDRIVPELKGVIAEGVDTVTSGRSILDDMSSLPQFLTKGLGKIKKSQQQQ